ncbi:hypothetical protein LSUB1_G002335 [Lachnellula subtilissima]|uniref:HD domain-containing protein n=1 Tax=Lachnellula subtilissima TaxID=602034 RepID=A0A8H8RZF3_9HELO|nr:hypothetical protein LSUB1_G002335 [Lachnellula subtilissima]
MLHPPETTTVPAIPLLNMSNHVTTRVLAGITVPHTPLITKALTYARKHLSDSAYNHVVRSWLFGHVIASKIPDFQMHDEELHAVAAILHDLGWDKTGELVSKDKRFEIDGANAARDFISREGEMKDWDNHRLQLAWDAIALHTTGSIALHKEIEVRICCIGIITDFTGPEKSPGGVLTRGVWDAIVEQFPRPGFVKDVVDTLCGLCRNKPETTYDNFVADFGLAYVEGYNLKGNRLIDILEAAK